MTSRAEGVRFEAGSVIGDFEHQPAVCFFDTNGDLGVFAGVFAGILQRFETAEVDRRLDFRGVTANVHGLNGGDQRSN